MSFSFSSVFFHDQDVRNEWAGGFSYCPAISARQNGRQRAPEASRELPESRDSGVNGNFDA
jgi:hypothetical protein